MSFDFEIEYKPRVLNGPADALSRVNRVSYSALFSESQPRPILWEAIRQDYLAHKETMALIDSVKSDPGQHPQFLVHEELLLFKGKVWFPNKSALQPLLVAKFHSTPVGGHAGIQRTLARLVSFFYWPDI